MTDYLANQRSTARRLYFEKIHEAGRLWELAMQYEWALHEDGWEPDARVIDEQSSHAAKGEREHEHRWRYEGTADTAPGEPSKSPAPDGDGGEERFRLRPRSEDGQRGFQDGMLQACRLLGYEDDNTSLEALVEFIRAEVGRHEATLESFNALEKESASALTQIRAALCDLADVETDTGETTLEVVELIRRDRRHAGEALGRAEKERDKAEAVLLAWFARNERGTHEALTPLVKAAEAILSRIEKETFGR